MPLLTFNTMLDKILSEQKTQTIRYNAEYWKRWIGKDLTLHIWWKNPRTKKYNPDCRKLGIAKGKLEVIYGRDITEEIAQSDGFNNLIELRTFFIQNFDINDVEEFNYHEFVIIRWKWD